MKQNFNELKNNVIKLVHSIASEPNIDEYFKEGVKTFVGIYEKIDLDKNEKLLDERLSYKKLIDIDAKKYIFFNRYSLFDVCDQLSFDINEQLDYVIGRRCFKSGDCSECEVWDSFYKIYGWKAFTDILEDYILKNKLACKVKINGEKYIAVFCESPLDGIKKYARQYKDVIFKES